MPQRSVWRATLLVALAACGFGSISTLMVFAHRNGLTLAGTMAWRYLVAAPFLLLIAGSGLRALTWKRGVTLFVLGGIGQVAISGISLYALKWLDVATLGFLFYTFPAWVALISALRGLERVDRRKLIALTLALVGIAVIIGAPNAGALPAAGLACALGAAFIYAAYIPLLHWMRGPLTASAASAMVIAGAGATYAAGALWRGELHALSTTGALIIAALALICTVMTFIAFLNGLAVLGPVRTAIISTVEPFYTTLLGAAALRQAVGPGTLLGGAMIASAVLLLQRQPSAE